MFKPIEYGHEDGSIVLPEGAPFDGKSVLIRTGHAIVEAWWDKGEVSQDHEGGDTSTGFEWVCYDGAFSCGLEDAKEWMPIPASI